MLRAVIFDMDGVIINSEPLYFKVETELFKNLGLQVSKEEHNTFVGTPTRQMWSRIKEKYNDGLDVEQMVEIERLRYQELLMNQGDIGPVSGIPELISELTANRAEIALASSSSREEINIVLDLLGIKRFFRIIIGGDEVKRGKPEPEIFLRAAEGLGIAPEECMVIEDSTNGVEAAKAAGMKCIGFKNPSSGSQDLSKADFIVEAITEINYRRLLDIFNRT